MWPTEEEVGMRNAVLGQGWGQAWKAGTPWSLMLWWPSCACPCVLQSRLGRDECKASGRSREPVRRCVFDVAPGLLGHPLTSPSDLPQRDRKR